MDPIYKAGHEPHNRRYQDNYDLIMENQQLIITVYCVASVTWLALIYITRYISDSMMNSQCKANRQSHWHAIKELDEKGKWLHSSYVLSIVHALLLLVLSVPATFQCEPPKVYRNDNGGFLANTVYTNDWCVDNGNKYEIVVVVIFAGYLTADFYQCIFLICDNSAGSWQNYLHHLIGLFGTGGSLLVGRMCLTLSCATCMTEMSTPFVSLRAILSMHKKSSSTLYMYNGMLMTFSFLIFRVVFQTWLVLWRLLPSISTRSEEMMKDTSDVTRIVMWLTLSMYITLVGLNYIWFNKMFQGLLKFFNKKQKDTTKDE